MSHLIVADGHFIGAPGEAEAWRSLIDEAIRHDINEVSILGDFLELWIGLKGLEQPWHESVLEPLRELRARGVYLRYIHGNKDYFINDWNRRHQLFDEVLDSHCLLDSEQGPLFLAHGDLVNSADHRYRFWRWFSRSWPVALLMRMLPRKWLGRRAQAVAQRMKATNAHHKSYFPEDALRARAQQMPTGPLVMVYGHFHVHREIEDGDKRVITLPFLGAENAGILLTDDGLERFPRKGTVLHRT